MGSVWLIIFFSTVNLSSERLISSPVVAVSATISVDDSSLQPCKSIVEHSPVTYEEAELDSMLQSWASGIKRANKWKPKALQPYRKLIALHRGKRRRDYLY
ncbi:hypothetical protein DY000_02023029 [Brassica cretica]|uniref:Uncharacterized protein n=1 Tax=Brassica cretica TaxID=69181 RepID=A0ABQ7EDV8_BRACR|nr:hypothetical protein DY000_02023029 [Brassica cretica]